jgi:DNA-nicking Smr family endonuclease
MMSRRTDGKGKSGRGARPLEGDALFRTVMETTTPLDETTRRRYVDEDPIFDGSGAGLPEARPVRPSGPPQVHRPKVVEPPATGHQPRQGFDRGTLRQVKQGKITVDGKLDLHGLTQAQAHMRLNRFIETAAHSGKRCVLIITGKGAPEAERRHGFLEGSPRGVLRRMTPIWLSARNLAPYIVDYQSALPRDGGDGALYVRLRKQA